MNPQRSLFSNGSWDKDDINEAVETAIESFEMGAKRSFTGSTSDKVIKVGPQKLTDKLLGIRCGHLTIPG
jgi:hypothetical protein